jgi:hypothetical protein
MLFDLYCIIINYNIDLLIYLIARIFNSIEDFEFNFYVAENLNQFRKFLLFVEFRKNLHIYYNNYKRTGRFGGEQLNIAGIEYNKPFIVKFVLVIGKIIVFLFKPFPLFFSFFSFIFRLIYLILEYIFMKIYVFLFMKIYRFLSYSYLKYKIYYF